MKIILIGASGKMGTELTNLAKDEIVCGVDLIKTPRPYPLYTSLRECKEEADMVIDFSSKNAIEERLTVCSERGIPAVLAATGYSEEESRAVEEFAKKIPVFQSGNFSLGIAITEYLSEKTAAFLGDDFDTEIIERHHNRKKDAPSGTALMLAESVNRGLKENRRLCFGRSGNAGARDKREIGIHAVRGGTIVGEHEVLFAGDNERISISHSAESRKIFALGALRAARWLCSQTKGLYGMRDMLKDLLK